MANPTQEERSRTGGTKSPHALGRKGLLQWAGVTRADMHLATQGRSQGRRDSWVGPAAVLMEGQQGPVLCSGWW